jgi:hypothetical protein
MSTKNLGKAAPLKKNLSVKKESSKKTKSTLKTKIIQETIIEVTAVQSDDLEEQEELESAQLAESSQGGSAAALAAASNPTEMSASFKNFRHHPDMENFYRFIYENDLRLEALAIVDEVILEKQQKRQIKAAKVQAH